MGTTTCWRCAPCACSPGLGWGDGSADTHSSDPPAALSDGVLSTDEAAEVHRDDETDGEIVMVSTGLHSSDGLELRLQAGTTLGEATCWTEKGALPVAATSGSGSAGSSRPGSGGCAWFAVPVPPPCALYGSHEGDMVVFCAAASSEGNASARSGVTSHTER